MTSKKKFFFYAIYIYIYIYIFIYIWKTTKVNFKMKKMIYSNMGYNKYITEHVEPNKYFYVRWGIFEKRSKYC